MSCTICCISFTFGCMRSHLPIYYCSCKGYGLPTAPALRVAEARLTGPRQCLVQNALTGTLPSTMTFPASLTTFSVVGGGASVLLREQRPKLPFCQNVGSHPPTPTGTLSPAYSLVARAAVAVN